MAWKVRDQMWKNRKTPEMVDTANKPIVSVVP
jgi:hypothetical protein